MNPDPFLHQFVRGAVWALQRAIVFGVCLSGPGAAAWAVWKFLGH